MTEVQFHSGLPDPLAYACRLLRKSQRSGTQVVVTGDAGLLDRLDALLWTFEPLEFLPHVRLRAGARLAAWLDATPIWLADVPVEAPRHDVLVNLGPDTGAGFESFKRLFDLVGSAPDEAAAGRQRWQYLKTRGYQPVHVEIGA